MCAQIRVNCVCVCLCEHDTHPQGLRSGTGVRRHADEHSFALRCAQVWCVSICKAIHGKGV